MLLPHPTGSANVERARLLLQLCFGTLVVVAIVACIADVLEPSTLAGDERSGVGMAVGAITMLSVLVSILTLSLRAATVRTDRAAWWLVTAGVASWGFASVAFTVWQRPNAGGVFDPVDAGFLAFYPAMSLALWLMVRARVVHFFRAAWLDGLIGFTGAAAICVALAVGVILPAGESGHYLAGNLKYPILDAVLLSQVVGGLVLTGGRAGRPWALLAGGISLFALADTGYVVLLATDSAHPYLVSPVWIAALALMATAALQVRRTPAVPVHSGSYSTLVLPLGFAVAMTGLLVVGAYVELPSATSALAGLSLLLVILRTGLTFRENVQLSQSQQLAMTDDLTGLANRRHLVLALERHVRAGYRSGPIGLMICDLDGFKFINDTLGHGAGDQILAEIGRRLHRLDGFTLIARLGGDEFAVVVPAPAQEASLRNASERWQAVFAEPVMIDGIALQVTGSLGGALSTEDMAPGELLRHADVAMYTAKADERPFELYRPERDDHSPAQLRLAAELRSALRSDQLRIHYQPKVHVSTGLLCGVEALVRWQHPRHGLIPPDQMLSIAQRAGLMREVTTNVLDQALGQLAQWHAAGSSALTMAVNLSISDLHDIDLPAEVAQLLRRHGIRGDKLVLEVTEDLVMARPERVADVVGGLRKLGVAIALDDFGAGRSSLAYVRRLQVAELKIDKQFMMRVEQDADARAIVRGAVELAHELGLKVVAEGVETVVGMQLLIETGCEEAQGFLISKPVPADQIDLALRMPVSYPPPATGASGLAVA